jgi:hypothetical protein
VFELLKAIHTYPATAFIVALWVLGMTYLTLDGLAGIANALKGPRR